MKNILIIASGYPTPGFPFAAFIEALAQEITRQGVEVTVIARQSVTWNVLHRIPLAPRFYTQEVYGKNIKIYRPYALNGEGRLGKFARWYNRWITTHIAKRLQKPDAVYAHFWLNAVTVIDYVKANQLPLIVASGEDQIYANKIDSKDRDWLKDNVKAVVCVSTKNKNESIIKGLASKQKCHVLPNAYNPNDFYPKDCSLLRQQLGIKDEDFVVCFCGRWNERKGIYRLDDALKRLNNQHIKAIYIGSQTDNSVREPDYEHAAFKGKLEHKELVDYLNASDVFVLPSIAEGCPNSVIEAMGCGLPIISSNMPFNADILDNSNSILIDPNDMNQIADAINKLYKNRSIRDELAKGAITKAQTLRLDNRVKKILQLL